MYLAHIHLNEAIINHRNNILFKKQLSVFDALAVFHILNLVPFDVTTKCFCCTEASSRIAIPFNCSWQLKAFDTSIAPREQMNKHQNEVTVLKKKTHSSNNGDVTSALSSSNEKKGILNSEFVENTLAIERATIQL